MQREELIQTLKTMQSDLNVVTVCGIALNRQVSALLELFAENRYFDAEDYVLRFLNFKSALTTFADSLEAFEQHASESFNNEDEGEDDAE